MPIPKLIHQTSAHAHDLHPALLANVQRIKALNPGWQHCFYDDQGAKDFIGAHYGAEFLKLYQRINPQYGPARADFFRYLLIHAVGGVYLDIKSTIMTPLDDVLRPDDAYILSRWNNQRHQSHWGWGCWPELGPEGEYQNWHVIAEARHPFLAAVVHAVSRNIINYRPELFGVAKLGVLRTTGPVAYTLAIEPIRDLHPHRVVDSEALGFRFSVVAMEGPLAHQRLYRQGHYSDLTTPVVMPRGDAPTA